MQSRILTLNRHNQKAGRCILYVMSRDQRVDDNHALLAAQQNAVESRLPLVVCFNLLPSSGVRGQEHYQFMLDGLREVADQLRKLEISFILLYGEPLQKIIELCSKINPAAIYFDFSPLNGPRKLAKKIAAESNVPVYVVDTHNIIPTWIISDKQEFAAHTIRSKIHKHLEEYLIEPSNIIKHPYTLAEKQLGIDFDDAQKNIVQLPLRGIKVRVRSGNTAAHNHLKKFLSHGLSSYAYGRNDISNDQQSGLSPYLHFGQISSLRVALETLYIVNERPLLFDRPKMAQNGITPNDFEGMNALFEEMIVRKELSDNFCLHARSYTSLDGANEWAKKTLEEHVHDTREFIYTLQQLEEASTHDAAWNTAQKQLITQGNIHGYMRMYWAKKILEWSEDPQTAIAHAIYLNDAFSIDGGDPNGYVGILWSIAGIHDRPWTERQIFGKIRYMNEAGLKRKFDLQRYIDSV